ncbi:MAG: hypothetical protein ACOYT8_02355 [Candidatus Dependentiae bacterium]
MNITIIDDIKTYLKAHLLAWQHPVILGIVFATALFFMGFHYLLFSSINLLAQTGKTLGFFDYLMLPLAHIFENTLQFFIVAAVAYYVPNRPSAGISQSFKVASDKFPALALFGIIQYLFSRTLFAGIPQLSFIILLIDSIIRVFLLFYATQFVLFKANNAIFAMVESSKLVLKTIVAVLISLAAAYVLVTLIHYFITFFQIKFITDTTTTAITSKLPLFLDYFVASYLKLVTLGIFATLLYRQQKNIN